MRNFAMLLMGSALFCGGVLAGSLSPDDAHQFGTAYGSLLGFSAAIISVSEACGGETKDLSSVWKERNEQEFANAERVMGNIRAEVLRQGGQKAANDFDAQFRQLLKQWGNAAAVKIVGQLGSLPPDKKAFVCKKWDAGVRAGEWDLVKKSPESDRLLAKLAQ